MKPTSLFTRIAALATCLLAAAGCNNSFGTGIRGSGTSKTESRTVPTYTNIETHGAFDVIVTTGPTPSLTVEADDNLLPIIRTQVSGNTLTVDSTASYSTNSRLVIRITHPAVKAITINGSGTTSLTNLDSDTLKLAIHGSGDITATGKVDTVTLSINGSGDIHAQNLAAKSATATISGSGSIDTAVSTSINATINGSGSITYHGTPAQVSSAIHGSGSINAR